MVSRTVTFEDFAMTAASAPCGKWKSVGRGTSREADGEGDSARLKKARTRYEAVLTAVVEALVPIIPGFLVFYWFVGCLRLPEMPKRLEKLRISTASCKTGRSC